MSKNRDIISNTTENRFVNSQKENRFVKQRLCSMLEKKLTLVNSDMLIDQLSDERLFNIWFVQKEVEKKLHVNISLRSHCSRMSNNSPNT
jgi:hypothetical protein